GASHTRKPFNSFQTRNQHRPNCLLPVPPQSTCDAIAQNLPAAYQPKYGLYFWDTTSPFYQSALPADSHLASPPWVYLQIRWGYRPEYYHLRPVRSAELDDNG